MAVGEREDCVTESAHRWGTFSSFLLVSLRRYSNIPMDLSMKKEQDQEACTLLAKVSFRPVRVILHSQTLVFAFLDKGHLRHFEPMMAGGPQSANWREGLHPTVPSRAVCLLDLRPCSETRPLIDPSPLQLRPSRTLGASNFQARALDEHLPSWHASTAMPGHETHLKPFSFEKRDSDSVSTVEFRVQEVRAQQTDTSLSNQFLTRFAPSSHLASMVPSRGPRRLSWQSTCGTSTENISKVSKLSSLVAGRDFLASWPPAVVPLSCSLTTRRRIRSCATSRYHS